MKSCADCGRVLLTESRPTQAEIDAVMRLHHCRPATTYIKANTHTEREKTPMQAVSTEPQKRPPAKQLIDHEDRRIARAAQKVLAAAQALDAVWEQHSEKAELRAEEQRLLKRLAKVRAQIKGDAKPKPDSKTVRAWAQSQGIEVNPAGIIPKHIVAAYEQAHQGGAA